MKNTMIVKVMLACCCFILGFSSLKIAAGPLSGKQLNRAVLTHGNYCGSGWSNGKWVSNDSEKELCNPGRRLLPPVDKLDMLCLSHDRDYCGKSKAAEDSADKRFIDSLTLLKPSLQTEWADNGCAETLAETKASFKTDVKGANSVNSVLDIAKQSINRTGACKKIGNKLAYVNAAIPVFKAKRAVYQKSNANKAAKTGNTK